MPLAFHIVGRPVDPRIPESFSRDDLLATAKFLAEAKASERKTILGWTVNTRSFSVALPGDKHRVWVGDLRRLIELPGRRAGTKDLETTIGRFKHATYVVPNARPFLDKLYRACKRSKVAGSVKLTDAQVEDLKLWILLVNSTRKGLSINHALKDWADMAYRAT